MIRGVLAALLAAGGVCGFPAVPPASPSAQPLPHDRVPGPTEVGEAAPPQPPRVAQGKLVSNAVSSVVVEIDRELVPLQIGPGTQLQVGSSAVGPRAVLPGSDVRVVFVPGTENLALKIQAVPGTDWHHEKN